MTVKNHDESEEAFTEYITAYMAAVRGEGEFPDALDLDEIDKTEKEKTDDKTTIRS